MARPHREPIKTVRVTRRLCAFEHFAGLRIGGDVALQLQVGSKPGGMPMAAIVCKLRDASSWHRAWILLGTPQMSSRLL